MTTLLIKNARCLATFDHTDPGRARELQDASIFIRGQRIEAIGPAAQLPPDADEVIDGARIMARALSVSVRISCLAVSTRMPASCWLFSWISEAIR